ncbi:MAG TPA: AI-2E family transporter [Ruminococcaceae bacterium]|nr:AI-2E family transporter [Oscillospiraceae bacterium]
MKLDRKTMVRIFFLAACIILFYLSFNYMNLVFGFIGWLIEVLTPFIIAGVVIFILNVPLKVIERHLFRPKNGKPVNKIKAKLRRPLAIVLSISFFLLVIATFLVAIIPEIGKSLKTIAEAIPGVISRLQEWIAEMSEREDFLGQAASQFNIDWDTLNKQLVSFLQDNGTSLVNSAFNVISTTLSTVVNVFLGVVLAVYILSKKEIISSNLKKLVYSVLPAKKADFMVEVGALTNQSFYNSITGQMIECVIIGMLTALGMFMFGFPYAALGGVVVAITSWIPMFGIFIGSSIIALLLLATADPWQALWFIVYMVVLQQIEGNLIFPRVVGSRIGLPPIIMISAIVLFSAFFGLIGLLVCGPVTYVIYTLIRRFVYRRIKEKNIPAYKYAVHYDSPDSNQIEEIQHEIEDMAHYDNTLNDASDIEADAVKAQEVKAASSVKATAVSDAAETDTTEEPDASGANCRVPVQSSAAVDTVKPIKIRGVRYIKRSKR